MIVPGAILPILVQAPTALEQPRGIVSESQAWKLGWPSMQGPYENFQVAQTRAKVVDDLSQARLVWESRERDFGRARHTTGTSVERSGRGHAEDS